MVLLRWADQGDDRRASELVKVAEFRSYVRPTWRNTLTSFCTALTGINQVKTAWFHSPPIVMTLLTQCVAQVDVDPAPTWPEVLQSFEAFMAEQGLIDGQTGTRLEKFMFCSDGPFDVRDFVVKQCYISQVSLPHPPFVFAVRDPCLGDDCPLFAQADIHPTLRLSL